MTPDIRDMFQKALALHQRGQTGQAQALYQEVLQRAPRHFDSLHLLGLTLIQQGQTEAGIAAIAQALAVRSDFPQAHYNMGHALLSLGRVVEALASFDTAIALDPRDPQAHFERGNALKELGRGDEALASYDAALRLFPRHAEAHNNSGIVHKEAGRLAQALACYDRAISLRPDYAEAHGNRGNALKELGRLQEAMASYDIAIRLRPGFAEAHSSRGNALAQLQLWTEALASHDRALALTPSYAEGHNNRGIVLKELGRAEEALLSYDRALQLRPGYAEAYSNRGNALRELKRIDEALASLDRALELDPGHAEAHLNRGNVLKDLGRADEAYACYARAATLKPALHVAPYNMSLIDLERRNFAEGFARYRWRWEGDPATGGAPRTTIPAWDGSPADGEVLLWAEQGIGDEVFFASMLSLAEERTDRIAVSADKRLHPIYRRSFPKLRLVDSVETRKAISGDYAAQAAIGDLGNILGADAALLQERRYPYLIADATRRAELGQELALPDGDLICGLSWRSGNRKMGAERSLALSDLEPLLGLPGLSFVNLQYGEVDAEIRGASASFGASIRQAESVDVFADIDGLLALIDLCDVVFTIDNLTAHLAGAAGKRAVVLVPSGSSRHWYWGGESPSFWYPTLHIAYQRDAGDWTSAKAEAIRWIAGAAQRDGRP